MIIICFVWAFVAQASGVSIPDFNRDIAPLIAKRCLECHNERDLKGDINLTTETGFTKGTKNGRLALELVSKGEMPPKLKGLSQKLPDNEIRLLTAWVEAGAAWPSGRVLDLYEATSDVRAGRDWWSLQSHLARTTMSCRTRNCCGWRWSMNRSRLWGGRFSR